MVDPRDKDFELNEVNWWSNWARVSWITRSAYVISSEEFDETFFNRAGFLAPERGIENVIGEIEAYFQRSGHEWNILLQNSPKYAKMLTYLKGHYRIVDAMSVMELNSPSFTVNREVQMEIVSDDLIDQWCETYLLSFYGEANQLGTVREVVRRLLRVKGVTLLLSKYRGRAAGTLAIFRDSGLHGVYCVGTKPQFRNLRVASTMVEFAHRTSKKERGRLILQTILSDNVEDLYKKLGFKRVYLKQFFKRGG